MNGLDRTVFETHFFQQKDSVFANIHAKFPKVIVT